MIQNFHLMFTLEKNNALCGVTEIFNARTRLFQAYKSSGKAPTMQTAEAILGFRPRKFISRYESIISTGYKNGQLQAVIQLTDMGGTGVAGMSCREYVRFYVDNGSGEWQDAGCTYVTPPVNGAEPAADGTLTCRVSLQWQPGPAPQLVNGPARLKAVLCCNFPPPAHDPGCEADFPYIWGDVKEIQMQAAVWDAPIAENSNEASLLLPMPAYRKIVHSKPVMGAAVKKTAAKKAPGVTGKVIPVYKSKNWRVAAL